MGPIAFLYNKALRTGATLIFQHPQPIYSRLPGQAIESWRFSKIFLDGRLVSSENIFNLKSAKMKPRADFVEKPPPIGFPCQDLR